MKVLQIAGGVPYSKVYQNLFAALEKKNIHFEVYIPQHDKKSVKIINKNEFPFDFYSNKIIKSYDRYLYFTKIIKMKRDILNNFNLKRFKAIHAHSLFSEGAVAYEISKNYNIPYIVAVRDTDMNQYYKKAIHLRWYALEILKNASNIIFLSEAYKIELFTKYIPNKYKVKLEKKVRIIPNGINKYWLENINSTLSSNKEEDFDLLFVGQIIKRKNILKIIEASKILEEKTRKKVNITLVGKKVDKDYYDKLRNKGSFKYESYLPKEELIYYYRKADVFVMPSLTETFGLVYAEAMSQGLPIIYTKGQGFDKQFNNGEVGFAVNPNSATDIADKIKIIIDNKKKIELNCINKVHKFNWNRIAEEYYNLYFGLS